ncbi:MAG: DUF4136 domain-containing protein [Tannerellaceae bacterium]|jgi:hypothetical protein|nr:DUF4136 domain-containing protein [Tannerellaceae bacterium]
MKMKRFIPAAIGLFFSLAAHAQSGDREVCRLGFTYEVDEASNWGKSRRVVTRVYPYTPAAEAGLRADDVIEEMDSLSAAGTREVILRINRLSGPVGPLWVRKDCKPAEAIGEDQLATAFSMYSVETTAERSFTCPFVTKVDTTDLACYRSFAFAPADGQNLSREETINACIAETLRGKGLSLDEENPDFVVETFYSFHKNPHYAVRRTSSSKGVSGGVYRYDFGLGEMRKFPFLDPGSAESEAVYLLRFGLRFVDKRPSPARVLWECEAVEMLLAPYLPETYAKSHIPLMCMQYPRVRYGGNVLFMADLKSYNHTGILYDVNRLERVAGVVEDSPADRAGIRAGDVIEKIDNLRLNRTAGEYAAAYKQFILNTLSLRNPDTRFTDRNGFRFCMHWKEFNYPRVSEALRDPAYSGVFSYLYKFTPYVNPSGVNQCLFLLRRGKTEVSILLRPEVRTTHNVWIP